MINMDRGLKSGTIRSTRSRNGQSSVAKRGVSCVSTADGAMRCQRAASSAGMVAGRTAKPSTAWLTGGVSWSQNGPLAANASAMAGLQPAMIMVKPPLVDAETVC